MAHVLNFTHLMYRLNWAQIGSFGPDKKKFLEHFTVKVLYVEVKEADPLGDRLVFGVDCRYSIFLSIFKGGYGGRIINIASVAGIMPIAKTIEHSSYTVAKHGVVALTRSFVPAPFPKRSVPVQISKFYSDFIKKIIKGVGFISFLHTHKANYKVP